MLGHFHSFSGYGFLQIKRRLNDLQTAPKRHLTQQYKPSGESGQAVDIQGCNCYKAVTSWWGRYQLTQRSVGSRHRER